MAKGDRGEELFAWLEKKELGKHSQAITDPDGSIGLSGLEDLRDLLEEDINDMVKELGFNIGERKRLTRGILELREEHQRELEAAAETGLTDAPGATDGYDANASPEAPRSRDRGAWATFKKGSSGPSAVVATEVPQYFEIIKSMVFVRSAPRKDAMGVGILRQGTHIEVRSQRRKDEDGNVWAQLTEAEFWRSCEPEPGKAAKCGFALIDGSSIGLGLLLRGPLPEDEVKRPSAPEATAMALAVDHQQLSQAERQAQMEEQHRLDAEKRLDEERIDKQTATADALERAKAQAEAIAIKSNKLAHREGAQPPDGAICLRSAGRFIYTKPSKDRQQMVRLECKPGTIYYAKEGSEWQGPQGGLWVQHATESCWMMLEDAAHGGAVLLNEENLAEFANVTIDCLTSRGDIRVFEAFISAKSTVRQLNLRLCSDTGLKPKGTFLFKTRPPAMGMPRKQDVMQEKDTLLDAGIRPGMEAPLYLVYPFNFEGDYHNGAFLRL